MTNEQKTIGVNQKEIKIEGHLIDSMILTRIWNRIMELGGDFDTLEFKVGKHKTSQSYAKILVKGKNPQHLEDILDEIIPLGAIPFEVSEVAVMPAPANMVFPDDFYSTTNNPTQIFYKNKWIIVEGTMMDKVIVVDSRNKKAQCKPIRDVKKGDLIVIGEEGVHVKPPERSRENTGIFRFMSSGASSEKPAMAVIRQIANDIFKLKKSNGKIAVVAGPALVHTGAAEALATLIREGFVDVLLSGNALAVHDVEGDLMKTSLGISLQNATPAIRGCRNHLVAINEIFKAGNLKEAVKRGVLKSGIIYECVKKGVPYVLAGSIRDDGPLPDVITDVVIAQNEYKKQLKDVDMVLMLASTLHAIGVGNMLPSTVKLVCL
ncbi:TIGR00300 family protein, partial [Candidatus Bathyarchaeota archaeon]|nr:TIGR00300 family protein [Candidatus Bathyarchaeota archaeon]